MGGGVDDGDESPAGAIYTILRGCSVPLAVQYRSKTSIYSLCGISEFTNPSIPPKKYRSQVLGGLTRVCAIPAPGPIPATYDVRVYSGSYDYSATTCAQTNNQLRVDRNQVGGVCVGTPAPTGGGVPALTPWFSDYGTPSAWTLTEDQTNQSYQGTAGFIPFFCQSTSGTATAQLTNEDGMNDAVARQNTMIGWDVVPATVTTSAARGAGVFSASYTYVQVAFDMSGLTAGETYDISITFGRRVTGSGNPFVAYLTAVYSFVAAGGVETTPFVPVPLEYGFDTNVLAYTVCLQP